MDMMNSKQPANAGSPESIPTCELPHQPDSPPAVPAGGEHRTRSDRRKKPTSPWDAFRCGGRRMKNRRAEEHRQPYYVDRFSRGMLLCIVLLVAASLIDAAFTIRLLRAGGQEANPVMDRLLSHSVEAFVIGKYLLTVVGLPLLLIFKNHYLFGTALRVGHLIGVAVALYVVLIGYQIVLFHQYIGW
jgi:hypothetical protein